MPSRSSVGKSLIEMMREQQRINPITSPLMDMMQPRVPMKFKRPWFVRLFDRPWKPLQRYYDVGPDVFVWPVTFRGWLEKKFSRKKPVTVHTYSTITTEYRIKEEEE